jgi:hypothetical protein
MAKNIQLQLLSPRPAAHIAFPRTFAGKAAGELHIATDLVFPTAAITHVAKAAS